MHSFLDYIWKWGSFLINYIFKKKKVQVNYKKNPTYPTETKSRGVCTYRTDLDSKDPILLSGHELPLNAIIRVIQIEVHKLNICNCFKKVHASVVAQQLRLTHRVSHNLSGKGVVRHQNLGHGLFQNTNHGPKIVRISSWWGWADRQGRRRWSLVTKENTHIKWRKKQVKVGEWQPMFVQW